MCKTIDAAIILALGMVPGMGNTRVNRLLAFAQRCGWEMSALRSFKDKNYLRQVVAWDSGIAALLGQWEDKFFAEAEIQVSYALQHGLGLANILEEDYPATLKRYLGDVAPPLLFLQGNSELLHNAAGAVVGTRSPSKRGVKAARDAAKVIVQHKATLVSGGAFGIDRAAHDGAVRAGGTTVVMLPQGIVSWSLPEHWRSAFDRGRILVVSAYLPDAPWQTHAAVSRNGLISALAQVVCVVEPRKQGGSILTMRHAIGQRKPVFVEPVSALSAGFLGQVRPLQELQAALATLDLEEMRCSMDAMAVQGELL